MCCITTILLVLVARIAILVWWLTDPQRFTQAADALNRPIGINMPAWIWGLLGFLFLPWTTLAFLFVSPGGVVGYEWVIIIIALLFDLSGHGGSYRHRNRFRR
jgi:hypothetical protein